MPLFAAVSVNSTLPLITSAVASFIKLYLLLLFVRVLLTWWAGRHVAWALTSCCCCPASLLQLQAARALCMW